MQISKPTRFDWFNSVKGEVCICLAYTGYVWKFKPNHLYKVSNAGSGPEDYPRSFPFENYENKFHFLSIHKPTRKNK